MLDHLHQFKQLTQKLKTANSAVKTKSPEDPFLARDASAQAVLRDMRAHLLRLQSLRDEAVRASVSHKEAKISKEFVTTLVALQSRMPQVKQVLSEMEVVARDAQESDVGYSTTRILVYRNVIAATTRSFKHVVLKTMDEEAAYREALRKKMARQLKYAYPDSGEEEINRLAEDPQAASAALASRLSGGNEDLEGVLADLKAKQQDLQKLEASVLELAEVFTYFAALVEMQGELIDSIESHVAQAREQVQEAVSELHAAQKWQRRYLNMKFTCYIFILVVLVVVSIGIMDYMGVFNKHNMPVPVDPSTPVQHPPAPHTHAASVSELQIAVQTARKASGAGKYAGKLALAEATSVHSSGHEQPVRTQDKLLRTVDAVIEADGQGQMNAPSVPLVQSRRVIGLS